MTNRELSNEEGFKLYCTWAKVPPTKRQASKFKRERGRAYRAKLTGAPKEV